MPIFEDLYIEEADGNIIKKMILVTISLTEYRSLVSENSRLQERVYYLENEIEELKKRSESNGE